MESGTMNKEQVYHEKIFPLMKQIRAVCKDHKIPMVTSFFIPTEKEPELCCTSAMLEKDWDPPEHLLKALMIIRYESECSAYTITRDANQHEN